MSSIKLKFSKLFLKNTPFLLTKAQFICYYMYRQKEGVATMHDWKRTSTTAERLKEALAQANMKQVELSRRTDIDKGTISNYLSGRYEPKANSISKMAKVLNVTEMWLWGYDVPMQRTDIEKKNDQLVELITLLRTDAEFLDMAQKLSKLTPEQRQSIKPILSAFTQ